MNFLAHMFLSCGEPALVQGNFLGDFLKNKHIEQLPDALKRGVSLHRSIDSFTDKHSDVRACTRRLRQSQGKYAPVVVDVLFDYILFQNWDVYSKVAFHDFENEIYQYLIKGLEYYPPKMKSITVAMVEDNFLSNYISISGLTKTFNDLIRRTSFPSNISKAIEDLKENEPFLNEKFNSFFPDMIALSEKFCSC